MGSKAGPSPLIPTLMVGVLGLVVCGPTLLSTVELLLVLLQGGVATFSFLIMLSLVLLLVLYVLTAFFPTIHMNIMSSSATHHQTSNSSMNSDGFGFGSLLLVVLFFILYNLLSQ